VAMWSERCRRPSAHLCSANSEWQTTKHQHERFDIDIKHMREELAAVLEQFQEETQQRLRQMDKRLKARFDEILDAWAEKACAPTQPTAPNVVARYQPTVGLTNKEEYTVTCERTVYCHVEEANPTAPRLKVSTRSPLFDWGVSQVAVPLGDNDLFRPRVICSMEWPPSRPPDLGGALR
ncbi:hypothetical protein Dimus_030595, partial [Dionaea muscipula]